MPSSLDAYNAARKLAKACETARIAEKKDPSLPVLDHYLDRFHIIRKTPKGVKEILIDRIAGTCHDGRTESFAANFMPLLPSDSEFASKWMNLYHAALSEGLHDPIKVYLIFGRFFVEEGNKRVSVTKYLENPLISASITELVVDPVDFPNFKLYEQYLQFEQLTGISSILMSKTKNYRKLLKLINADEEHPLTTEQTKGLRSLFYTFENMYKKVVPSDVMATEGDGFLIFLEVYGYHPETVVPDSVMEKELESILPLIKAYPHHYEAPLLTGSQLSDKKPTFSFRLEAVKAALIEAGTPQESSWTKAHAQAFDEMAEKLGNKVKIKEIFGADTPDKVEKALEEAIAWGAQVIFTSHPLMLQTTNRYAAKYPKIKFLNCSLNPEATTVRSYYTRGYEIQFLQGIAAAAMSTSGKIGYIADYPIYGAIADINAFAIGVAMVRPGARVYLDWSTTETPTNTEFPLDIDMIYISGQDFDTRIGKGKRFGLFDVRTGKFSNLSLVQQKWSVFYTRIMSSILNRSYKADEQTANGGSINYWLGLSNGLIDVSFSDELPYETHRLIDLLRTDITEKRFFIFGGIHAKERGADENASITMNDLARMDFLVGNIVGKLPDDTSDKLIPSAEKLVAVHGLDELEPGEQTPKEKYTDSVQSDSAPKIPANDPDPSNSGLVKVISSSVQAGDAEGLEKGVQAANLSTSAKHE